MNIDNLIVTEHRITSFIDAGANVHLTWNTVPGEAYQMQFAGTLEGSWTNLGNATIAAGFLLGFTDTKTDAARFYRVVTP